MGEGAIQTISGTHFSLVDPKPEQVSIQDIAHALSHNCRFAGHCTDFYSVAQHSVLVMELVPKEHRLWALLHDAAEAYIGDLVRPLKHLECMAPYREIEKRVMAVICTRFGLPLEQPQCVTDADQKALATEIRALMPASEAKAFETLPRPLRRHIEPLMPEDARWKFLAAFGEATR